MTQEALGEAANVGAEADECEPFRTASRIPDVFERVRAWTPPGLMAG